MTKDKEVIEKLDSIDKRLEEQNQKLEELINAMEAVESHTNILG